MEVISCLGALVQSCCGEGGALQTNVTGSVPAILGLPPLTGVCSHHLHCSGSRLLYMERALRYVWFQFSGPPRKRGLGWVCVLCLPCPSSSGCQELDGRILLSFGVPSPLRGPSLFPRAPVKCVRLVSVLGSWPLAANLLANVNHPESQEAFG